MNGFKEDGDINLEFWLRPLVKDEEEIERVKPVVRKIMSECKDSMELRRKVAEELGRKGDFSEIDEEIKRVKEAGKEIKKQLSVWVQSMADLSNALVVCCQGLEIANKVLEKVVEEKKSEKESNLNDVLKKLDKGKTTLH